MPRTAMARALASAALLLLAGFGGGTAQAASTFDPALRFRVLPTDHFIIYFHQGEERLARRLAAGRLARALGRVGTSISENSLA